MTPNKPAYCPLNSALPAASHWILYRYMYSVALYLSSGTVRSLRPKFESPKIFVRVIPELERQNLHLQDRARCPDLRMTTVCSDETPEHLSFWCLFENESVWRTGITNPQSLSERSHLVTSGVVVVLAGDSKVSRVLELAL